MTLIAWMQRHKKYLVITIWVSTIAFIGAGFVGWGQFDYGVFSKDSIVVGNVEVSKKELAFRYQDAYSQYSAITGQQKLDPALEKQIEEMVVSSLVSEALLLNLANEWNLRVLDDEVASMIANIKAFQKDGKFDKQTYVAKLGEKGLDPKTFEAAISKSLLIQKLQKLVSLPSTKLETEAFTAAYFSQDRINVEVIPLSLNGIVVSDAEAQTYFDANKAKFKTTPKYDLEILTIKPQVAAPTDEELKTEYDAKAAQFQDKNGTKPTFEQVKPLIANELIAQKGKKEALKTFVEFKNGKIAGSAVNGVDLNSSSYPPEFIEQLASAKSGSYIKPIAANKEFIAAKVVKINPSAQMDFASALPLVKKDVAAKKASEKLKADAANAVKNFNGKSIGLVSRAEDGNLSFLSQNEAQSVMSQIMASSKLDGFIILQDKAVVYKIMEQNLRFSLNSQAESNALSNEAAKYKAEILMASIMEKLKNTYKVEQLNKQLQGSK